MTLSDALLLFSGFCLGAAVFAGRVAGAQWRTRWHKQDNERLVAELAVLLDCPATRREIFLALIVYVQRCQVADRLVQELRAAQGRSGLGAYRVDDTLLDTTIAVLTWRPTSPPPLSPRNSCGCKSGDRGG